MKTLKKHLHGLIGAFLFVSLSIVILILSGFTVKLPLPAEESVIIDFSSKISKGESDSNISENSENIANEESSNEKVVQEIESGKVSYDENIVKEEKINRLFGNPFSNNGTDNKNSDGNSLDNDNNDPDDIVGKLSGRKKIVNVEPVSKENLFGKVVLQITVNEKGNVVDIQLISSNCNECVQPAKDAVYKWKYETLPGSGLQIGTVVIEFKQR